MKILVQQTGTGRVERVDVPAPVVGPGQVRILTRASVVSVGTERTAIEFGRKSLLAKAMERPQQVQRVLSSVARDGLGRTVDRVKDKLESYFAPGYSSAGSIEEVGALVRGLEPGQRVACAGAGYAVHAERVVVPENLVVALPDDVSFEAAAFTTLGAIALQGVRQADVRLGEFVAVIGLGLLGQLTVQMLVASGVRPIAIDLDAERVRLAAGHGAVAALRSDDVQGIVREATGGIGVDATIITAATSSEDPVRLGGDLTRERGRVVIVGAVPVNVPRSPYYEKELDVRMSRSYGPGRYDPSYEEKGHDYPVGYVRWTERRNMEAFVRLLSTGDVEVGPLITHRYTFEDGERAYSEIMDPAADVPPLGVVLEYPAEATVEPSRVHVGGRSAPAGPRPGIGLIGPGSFARDTLIPALKSLDVDLRGVVSGSGVSGRNVAERHGFAYLATAAELLNDEAIAAVIIATPHASHAVEATAALTAGKATFVEKPLALNQASLREVLRAAQGGPPLMVGFNRRFAPATRFLSERLEGVTGARVVVIRVNAGRIPANHWIHDPEVGGGRLLGEGCHFIDLAAYLVGSGPVAVAASAVGGDDAEADLRDNFVVTLRFPDGSIGSIVYTSRGDKESGKERVEVFAGGMTGVIDDFRRAEVWRGGKNEEWKGKPDKGHQAELAAFVEAVRTGSESPIPLPDLAASSLAALRAVDALRSGRTEPVEWSDPE